MALEGTLKDFSLADIFQLIGLQRKTGVLTLRSSDDTVTVTFLDGKVVGADSLSHRLENRLGHVLIRSELLTQDQLNRALEIQKETLQRLGFILVHYDIISVDSLKQAIQAQIHQIIFRLFRWKDGDYHFSQETTIEYDRDYVVPVSAESILMEGARMIDEWPIIEKRIRSYDMVFRKKMTDQEIVVVGATEEADEIDFDAAGAPGRRRKPVVSDKIRISREEKAVYDMVDGTMTVREIMDVSKYAEFDTAKALYELLTRGLVEEVRGSAAAAVLAQVTPLDDDEVAETPVPLPLVAVLALLAIISVATSFRNPLNSLRPLGPAQRSSSVTEVRKAISIARIEQIGEAVEAYNLVNGHLPARLQDMAPVYLSAALLHDPWGHAYKYLPQPQRYLVIGFTPDEKPDTDLFLSHVIDAGAPSAAASKPVTGGIQLLD
jgi:Domain of unknown function (DUF4388)